MKKIFTLLLLLCSLHLFSQTIYYVKPSGNDANNGTSWTTAFRTVQNALATITSGEIWVAAGTYYPDEIGSINNNDRNASFYLKNAVALYGGFAGTETALFQRDWKTNVSTMSGEIDGVAGNGNNSLHVVRSVSVNKSAVLDGFTITAGNARFEDGGGMFNASSSATISNCIFSGNASYADGAGMYNNSSAPTISNCIFTGNNSAYHGGGMYNDYSSAAIINCRFIGNFADYGAGITNSNSHPSLVNSSFVGNIGGFQGGAIYNLYSAHTIINCSFTRNADHYGGGAFLNVHCFPTLINCILWGNNGSFYDGNEGGQVVSYSIVEGGYPGTGNLNADPLFINAVAGDLRLQGCSPAIDAGRIIALPSGIATDLDGNPRYVPGEVDMGTNEFQPGGMPSIIFVNRIVSGGLHNGSSWANAFDNLTDALQKAATCKNTEIWVTADTYYPIGNSGVRTASFMLKNNTTIRGGFEGTEVPGDPRIRRYNFTTLSGDIDGDGTPAGNAYHVVQGTDVDNTAVLDGFIITGGNADGDANFNTDRGAGMYNERSYPTVTNCIITGNIALNYGGGVFNSNSDQPPVFTNSLFTQYQRLCRRSYL
jgi:hypothetical protein